MRALRRLLTLAFSFGLVAAASAAEVPIPPVPAGWVTDTAGFLSQQTVATLDDRLRAYQASTGHQILVYVAPTTGLAPTEDWTNRAFTRWKVGRKKIDDGLVLFVFPTDHKVRIEVGYGLEQTIPDVIAARIIRNTITPKIREGQPDLAVTSAIDELLALIGGEPQSSIATSPPESDAGAPASDDSGTDMTGVAIGIVIALLVIVLMFWLLSKLPRSKGPYISGGNSGFTAWDALSIGASLLGGFSGGGGGGGGFSGGGGMGGGGGATGSW